MESEFAGSLNNLSLSFGFALFEKPARNNLLDRITQGIDYYTLCRTL